MLRDARGDRSSAAGPRRGGQILVSAVVRWLAGERSGATFTSVGALDARGAFADAGRGVRDPVDCGQRDRDDRARHTAATGHGRRAHVPARRSGPRDGGVVGGAADAGRAGAGAPCSSAARPVPARPDWRSSWPVIVTPTGAIVLLGTCDAELGMPYQPWVQVLGQLLRALPGRRPSRASHHDLARADRAVAGDRAARCPASSGPHRPIPRRSATGCSRPSMRSSRGLRPIATWWSCSTTSTGRAADAGACCATSSRSDAARIVVVGTFRDTGDEVTDPLAACLADLRRSRRGRTAPTRRTRPAGGRAVRVRGQPARTSTPAADGRRGSRRAQRRQRVLPRRAVAPPRGARAGRWKRRVASAARRSPAFPRACARSSPLASLA